MGINGIAEAFLQGVGDPKVIYRQSRFLVIFWLAFMTTFYVSFYSGLGITSLVIANMVNLSLRILFVWNFASTIFGEEKVASNLFIPKSIYVWSAFAGSFAILCSPFENEVMKLGVGMGTGLLVLFIM